MVFGKSVAYGSRVCSYYPAQTVSKTLETNQVLHKWYPAKYTSDKCDLCKQQCETALACPVLSDATTAAHDKVRKRFRNALEKGLGREMEGWEFCWETQVWDAFPVHSGVRHMCVVLH